MDLELNYFSNDIIKSNLLIHLIYDAILSYFLYFITIIEHFLKTWQYLNKIKNPIENLLIELILASQYFNIISMVEIDLQKLIHGGTYWTTGPY